MQKHGVKPSAAQSLPRSPSATKQDSAPGANAGKQLAAKRRAGSGAGKKQPPAKKLKVEDPHQRSIASFLAQPSRAAAAGSTPEIKTEQRTQEVNNCDSAVKEEEEDLLADVDVEGQMKLERAIQRAAAATRKKQQHKAEDMIVTDLNEGGFVKQGPDPLEAAAALGASAMVADLSDADILADDEPEPNTAGKGAGHRPDQSHEDTKPFATAPRRLLNPQQPAVDEACAEAESDSLHTEAPVKHEEDEEDTLVVSKTEAADRAAEHRADGKLQKPTATVKLEGLPDVKLEDPAVERQLRQLGMFSSARSNSKGVANALIEKRKVRQRKAGIGTPEEKNSAASGAADASASAQPTKAPASAQQDETADNGVGTTPSRASAMQAIPPSMEYRYHDLTWVERIVRTVAALCLAPRTSHGDFPWNAGGHMAEWQTCAVPPHSQSIRCHGGHHKAAEEGRDHGRCIQGHPAALPRCRASAGLLLHHHSSVGVT